MLYSSVTIAPTAAGPGITIPMAPLTFRAAAAIFIPLALSDNARADADSLLTLQPPPSEAATDEGRQKPPLFTAPKWTIQVEPVLWYVAPSGKVRLPVASGNGPGSFTTAGDEVRLERLNLDSPRFEPAGEVHLSAERWRFSFSGATYGIDRDTTADSSFRLGSVVVAPGDALNVDFSLTTVELTAGYCIWDRVFSGPFHTQRPDNAVDSLARLYILGGARIHSASFDLQRLSGSTPTPPSSASADEFFGEPIVGARLEIEIADDFTLDMQLSGGVLPLGDKSSYSFDILVGFQWRPIENLGIQIGYRQLLYSLADGEDASEFKYTGRLAGLFAGIVLRF